MTGPVPHPRAAVAGGGREHGDEPGRVGPVEVGTIHLLGHGVAGADRRVRPAAALDQRGHGQHDDGEDQGGHGALHEPSVPPSRTGEDVAPAMQNVRPMGEAEPTEAPPVAIRQPLWVRIFSEPMWVLGLVILVDEMDKNIVRGLITPLKEEFGVGDLGISVLLSLALLFNGIITVPAGYLADRWKRTQAIGHTVIGWSALTAAGAASVNFPMLVGLRSALGFGQAITEPSAASLIGDYYPTEQRGRAFSIQQAMLFVGAGLGIGVGGAIGATLGWRWALVIMALPGALVALLVYKLREPRRGAADMLAAIGAAPTRRGREPGAVRGRVPAVLPRHVGQPQGRHADDPVDPHDEVHAGRRRRHPLHDHRRGGLAAAVLRAPAGREARLRRGLGRPGRDRRRAGGADRRPGGGPLGAAHPGRPPRPAGRVPVRGPVDLQHRLPREAHRARGREGGTGRGRRCRPTRPRRLHDELRASGASDAAIERADEAAEDAREDAHDVGRKALGYDSAIFLAVLISQVIGFGIVCMAIPGLRAGLTDAVPAHLRGTGFGAFNLAAVVFGQAAAPFVVGGLSAAFDENLRTALSLVTPISLGGALVLFRARKFLDEDMNKIMMAVLQALQDEQDRHAEKTATSALDGVGDEDVDP